jgi:uncharacterized membrane protein
VKKSLWKTVSWLVISYLLFAACTWYETGSLIPALFAALWACTIKTPLYWLHEILWHREKKPVLRRIPLPVICPACAS